MSNRNEQQNNKQVNTKNGTDALAGNTNKSSFSLVMKLNLHTIFYTIGVLLTVNILLCLAVSSFTLWKAEENTAAMLSELAPMNETIMDYTFAPTENERKGFELWGILHQATPLDQYDVLRRVWFDKTDGHPLTALKYQMAFEEENVTVTYDYGKVLEEFLIPLYALLILLFSFLYLF